MALLSAIAAAAWFSGGSAGDRLRGMPFLAGWFLASRGAVLLIDREARRGRRRVRPAGPRAGSTDWMAPHPPVQRAAADAVARGQRTLLAVCITACECTIYGGIAAGGAAAGWTGMWPMTIAALASIAVRETVSACRGRAGDALRGTRHRGGTLGRAAATVLAAPAGGRVLLAALALLAHGPRIAIFAVLAWTVISLGWEVTRPPGSSSGPGLRPETLVTLRDDGALVRRAGRLVRGNLTPLPGALAGLAATAMLAVVGMGNVFGIVKLAAPVTMLLAAPGSSHRHDGRADWLVPAVLQAGQYVYLGTLGLSSGVPAPVIFVLCALTAMRYRYQADDAAAGQRPAATVRIGWEGRMFWAGLGAMAGFGEVAFLALAAYLGAAVCVRVVTGAVPPRGGARR